MRVLTCVVLLFAVFTLVTVSPAQQSPTTPVPNLITYGGTLILSSDMGVPAKTVGVTFAIYRQQDGGAPIWLETQNVMPDSGGHYSVLLGSTRAEGIPADLFNTQEQRWLGVQVQGEAEQSRVLLVSVPYAMKAADAETVGGLPPSAFLKATPSQSIAVEQVSSSSNPGLLSPALGGTGSAGFLPIWSNSATLGNSALFQSGTGAAAKVGINLASPASTLDVNGAGTIRGLLKLPAIGTATATAGSKSQAEDFVASSFNSGTQAAVNQTFQWQAEPAANNTASPAGTLNLLFASGTVVPAETELKISNKGVFSFATGQTFPGTGTVTNIASGTGLTGGPITKTGTLSIASAGVTNAMLQHSAVTVNAGTDLTGGGAVALGSTTTLNLDTSKVPQLNAANTFTGNQTVNGNLSATGVVTGSAYNIGSDLFAFGFIRNWNAFLGFAGNTTMRGTANTASGYKALLNNINGYNNTADGYFALFSSTAGSGNTAMGQEALLRNTGGNGNTAIGVVSLPFNTTGSSNTAAGVAAGETADGSDLTGSNNTACGANTAFGTGFLTNATAIGANAEVDASNALVLGSIKGVNSAAADTLVGIGTTNPSYKLHVGSANSGLRVEGPPQGGTGAVAASFGGHGDFAIDGPGIVAGRFVVKDSGLVGIGTSSPDTLLSVNGGADKPGGGFWATFSDRRLKTLNGHFTSGLEQILQLEPVRYRYKDDNALGIHDPQEHVGLVAQEVQRVIPEAVTENSQGYLLVNNDPILWAMLNAIKHQQGQIQEQQEQIRAQQAEIARLSSQVSTIQASLNTNDRRRAEIRSIKAQTAVAKQ